MSDGFELRPTGTYPAADTLDYVADLIAVAARTVVTIDGQLDAAPVGSTLKYIVEDLVAAWADVGRELVEAALQLGTLVSETASCYLTVDAEESYRFDPVLHHG